jgi:3-phosphoshikimate 1-carboxyvinyltransferase
MMGGRGTIENLSEANDTQLMKRLLPTTDEVIDAEDAGTVMRFLTAYYALTGQRKILTGTPRMQQRPIRELVDALRTLGAIITYGAAEGYPPVQLGGFPAQQVDTLSIRGDISSQFISALMMVAPVLPRGLTLSLTGRIASRPYIEMTAALMRHFGVSPTFSGNTIHVPSGVYRPTTYTVEPDWSAASYWFAVAALAEKADLLLPRVTSQSLQGDRVIASIMTNLGVQARFEPGGLRLSGGGPKADRLIVDFSECPDLAQTVLPACAALKIPGEFTGMESLRIKETDRIQALQQELAKIGATLTELESRWILTPGASMPESIAISTYNDHRMAMGFAPLATRTRVTIDDRTVVRKSYPAFWEDAAAVGFRVD